MPRKKLLDSRQQLFKEGAIAQKAGRRSAGRAGAGAGPARHRAAAPARAAGGRPAGKVKAAAAQVEAARGHHETAQAQVGYSEIRSPITGVVTDRPLYPGEMANAGMPLLTVMDVSSVVARVNMAQDQARNVKVGNEATLTPIDGSEPVTGKVTIVSPAVDPNSTTVQVWVQADNPGERLRAGAVGPRRDRRRDDRGRDARFRRRRSCRAEEGGTMVIVGRRQEHRARRQGADRRARGRLVQVLMELQPDATIEGVQPGERVVTVGGLGLEDRRQGADHEAGREAPRPKRAENEKKADRGQQVIGPAEHWTARHGKPIIFVILTLVARRRLSRHDDSGGGLSRSGFSARRWSASTTASRRSIRCR